MSQLTKMLIASTFIAAAGFATAQTATSSGEMQHSPSGAMAAPTGSATSGDASGATATTGTTAAGTGMAADTGAKPTSSDPYVQKRESDATAKKEYKDKKKIAKEEYKQEKAAAKSDLNSEKQTSKADRKAAIAADPTKAAKPGDLNYSGK